MNYRIGKDALFDRFIIWNSYLRRRIRLVACGGTALTLLGVKDSTKDIDLIIPDIKEYSYLIKILQDIGYKAVTTHGWSSGDVFTFDIFKGNLVHTTELLESPLVEGNHSLVKEFSFIYLGVLNDYDLIISKLFRGTQVDYDDCVALIMHKGDSIDLDRLVNRYRKTASYDISGEKVNRNLDLFLERIKGAI
jgi:hypothetical protein